MGISEARVVELEDLLRGEKEKSEGYEKMMKEMEKKIGSEMSGRDQLIRVLRVQVSELNKKLKKAVEDGKSMKEERDSMMFELAHKKDEVWVFYSGFNCTSYLYLYIYIFYIHIYFFFFFSLSPSLTPSISTLYTTKCVM